MGLEEYFIFSVGHEEYCYTNSSNKASFDGKEFIPASISRKEISRENLGSDASIVSNIDLKPLNLFKKFNPNIYISVKIYNSDKLLIFYGKILSVEFDLKTGEAVAKCGVLNGLLTTQIPFRCYERTCGFECFDANCTLDENNYKLALIGAEISENKRQIRHSDILERGAEYYFGGYVTHNLQFGFISGGSGDMIELLFPMVDLDNTGIIYVYAGCDKTIETCKNKFNNSRNFGGFPFIPAKNPVTSGY